MGLCWGTKGMPTAMGWVWGVTFKTDMIILAGFQIFTICVPIMKFSTISWWDLEPVILLGGSGGTWCGFLAYLGFQPEL